MRSVAILAVVSAAVWAVSCQESSPGHGLAGGGTSPGRTAHGMAAIPARTVLNKADLDYYWNLPLHLEAGETIAALYKLDENLYAVTDHDRVFCVDALRGIQRWGPLAIRTDGDPIFPPAHAEQRRWPPIRFRPRRWRMTRAPTSSTFPSARSCSTPPAICWCSTATPAR